MEERVIAASAVEVAVSRCIAVRDRILRAAIKPKDTLIRMVNSELSFLRRISTSNHISSAHSFNIGHLEAVVHVLLQPSVTGVSRICKSIRLSSSRSIYADIVCSLNGNPVWIIVSDRNPRHVSWEGDSFSKDKGLKNKIQQVVDAASQSPLTLRPTSVVFFFSSGLHDDIYQKIQTEFGGIDLEMDLFSFDELELENEWTGVVLGRLFSEACVVEVKVDKNGGMTERTLFNSSRIDRTLMCAKSDVCFDVSLGKSFCSLVCGMKCWCCTLDHAMVIEVGLPKVSALDADSELLNFDTTSMIAVVSGISNGGTERLVATPESELRNRYKGNYEFVLGQVDSEIQSPIHHALSAVTSGKRGILCDSVHSEFQELIAMYGGPSEKLRAKCFLKLLKLVPDSSSTRMANLPTTRKLDLKNKVVFGTGDYWKAVTLTGNKAFVRAVSQTGMSISVVEHKPRALIGD